MPATVDKEKCTGCGLCVEICLMEAISLNPQQEIDIETEACLECGICENECPNDAITVIRMNEILLPARDTKTTSSLTKELSSRFNPPRAVPSDESLIRNMIPTTGFFLSQTYPVGFDRELSRLIREKITALWEILACAIKKTFSATSQNRNTQGRIDRPISNGARHHRHRYGR